jgi:dTDP-4-dehydrorhamnose 3,5-epimerase
MIFRETPLQGAFLIELEKHVDTRGYFARSWCAKEFKAHGLSTRMAQCNVSLNLKKGTLRGMHYQVNPFEEAKLVRCTRGALYDVIVDLRHGSRSFREHFGTELTAENGMEMYVPEGFAHGFLTLQEDTEVFYQISEFYAPGSARGFRWDDPAFRIDWPAAVRVISERDRDYPDFDG